MYEGLTKYLPELDKAEGYGEWVVDRRGRGTTDNLMRVPRVSYGSLVMDVVHAIYAFEREHPEYVLNRYGDILERNGLRWDGRVMREADVSRLDGQAVAALILGAVRADRFCDGALIGFFEDGSIKRWFEKLRDADEAGERQ